MTNDDEERRRIEREIERKSPAMAAAMRLLRDEEPSPPDRNEKIDELVERLRLSIRDASGEAEKEAIIKGIAEHAKAVLTDADLPAFARALETDLAEQQLLVDVLAGGVNREGGIVQPGMLYDHVLRRGFSVPSWLPEAGTGDGLKRWAADLNTRVLASVRDCHPQVFDLSQLAFRQMRTSVPVSELSLQPVSPRFWCEYALPDEREGVTLFDEQVARIGLLIGVDDLDGPSGAMLRREIEQNKARRSGAIIAQKGARWIYSALVVVEDLGVSQIDDPTQRGNIYALLSYMFGVDRNGRLLPMVGAQFSHSDVLGNRDERQEMGQKAVTICLPMFRFLNLAHRFLPPMSGVGEPALTPTVDGRRRVHRTRFVSRYPSAIQ